MRLDTRRFASQLRYLPRVELEKYCRNCGMDDRELYATLDYIYHIAKAENICDRLGMSRSTFMRHKMMLSIRLYRYLFTEGIIDELEANKVVDPDLED